MPFLTRSLLCLAATTLALGASLAAPMAQDAKPEAKPADDAGAEKKADDADKKLYELKQVWETGSVFTLAHTTDTSMSQKLRGADGTTTEVDGQNSSYWQITEMEILKVTKEGVPTKLSLLWHSGEVTTIKKDPVSGENEEETDEIPTKSLKMVYEWSDEDEQWYGEHESGGEDLTDAQIDALARNQQLPIYDVRLPDEPQGVGDSWDLSEDQVRNMIKSMLPPEQAMVMSLTMKEVTGTCTVDELVEDEEEGKYLLISFETSMQIETEQGGAKISGPLSVSGTFYFDLNAKRVIESVEDAAVDVTAVTGGGDFLIEGSINQVRSIYAGRADDLLGDPDAESEGGAAEEGSAEESVPEEGGGDSESGESTPEK